MAILKFVNGENKSLKGTKDVLNYIKHPEKTTESLTFGLNCDPLNAYEEFLMTKLIYGKDKGRQHVHFTQSFAPGEGSPELIHEIGKKLLENEAFKGFQVVMTTHLDKEHLHNHFVINTVNQETGKKWKQSRLQMAELKDLSDELCKENGLSVIDKVSEGYKNNGEYRATNEERSWKHELALAVGECRYLSRSKEEFIENMGKLGYGVSWDYKGESDEIKLMGAMIGTCRDFADDEEHFIQNLKHYNLDAEWQYKAKITSKETPRDKSNAESKPIGIDLVFNTKSELDKYISKLDEKLFDIEWTDELKFIAADGKILTPESFEKGARYSGSTLREAFEINRQNEQKKSLPHITEIKLPRSSNESKELFLIVKACKQYSFNKDDFIRNMKRLGYGVKWDDKRKYITFRTPTGRLIRNRMLYPAKQFTKEALEDTFLFNSTIKNIINESAHKTPNDLIKVSAQKGYVLSYDDKKHRYNFQMGDKKCYFEEEIIERIKITDMPVLPVKEEILKALVIDAIMFTTPGGKKCTNKQLYPADNYTKDALLQSFEETKQRVDSWELHNRMELLLFAINSMAQEDKNPNEKSYPLSALEGQSLKDRAIELAKGKGLNWDKGNGW